MSERLAYPALVYTTERKMHLPEPTSRATDVIRHAALERWIEQTAASAGHRALKTAWQNWRWVYAGTAAYTQLAATTFQPALRLYRQAPNMVRLSRSSQNNEYSLLRRIARKFQQMEAEECSFSKWEMKMIFDLAPPGQERWGVANRKLALAPYYAQEIPPRLKQAIMPFLQLRDERSSGALQVHLLDGSPRELVCRTAWTRRAGLEDASQTIGEKMFCETIRAICGFMSLPTDAEDPRLRGLGIPFSTLRLAHIMDGQKVSKYLKFLVARRGTCTGSVEVVRVRWNMLMRGANAYCRFGQRELLDDLAAVLGDQTPTTPTEWLAWCDKQVEIVERTMAILQRQRQIRSRHRQGRSAARTLSVLLDRARPLEEIVWPTILWLADGRPLPAAPIRKRFVHEVKIFTVAALAVVPLRAANWTAMQWGKNLFFKDSRWKIYLEVGDFKNRRSLDNDYLLDVGDIAQSYVTAYYELWTEAFGYDPLHPENKTRISLVMANYGGSPSKCLGGTILSQRLHFLSVAWNVRIGAHAFRHIVATDWLKRHPDDHWTAAGLLNDSEQQVKKAYAHLRAADHARRANTANADMHAKARGHLLELRRRAKKETKDD